MQKWIGIGNLTREPELVQGTNKPLCRLNMAVNDNYVDRDGNRDVEFLNIIVWGKMAENCVKFLNKGSKIGVVGKVKTRKWDDENRNTKYAIEIIAQEVEFIKLNKKDGDRKGELQQVDINEDLPF